MVESVVNFRTLMAYHCHLSYLFLLPTLVSPHPNLSMTSKFILICHLHREVFNAPGTGETLLKLAESATDRFTYEQSGTHALTNVITHVVSNAYHLDPQLDFVWQFLSLWCTCMDSDIQIIKTGGKAAQETTRSSNCTILLLQMFFPRPTMFTTSTFSATTLAPPSPSSSSSRSRPVTRLIFDMSFLCMCGHRGLSFPLLRPSRAESEWTSAAWGVGDTVRPDDLLHQKQPQESP